MGKPKNLTDTIFADIVSNKSHIEFITNMGDDTYIPELSKCKKLYLKLVEKNKKDLETLAVLEETITQIRCREAARKEFKISEVRGYIYARAPFNRKGTNMKDIRVVVGKTSEFGSNLDTLYSNKEFVKLAKKKLVVAMTESITANMLTISEVISQYQTVEQ